MEEGENERTINRSGKQILRWKLNQSSSGAGVCVGGGELEAKHALSHTQVCREKHLKWRFIFWNDTVYASHLCFFFFFRD